MQSDDASLIPVQRDWNGWRTVDVRLGDLRNIHWFQPRGAPRPLVHGYVSCGTILNGDLPHDCNPADAPHQLLVCVLKKHTVDTAYRELARRADAEAASAPAGRLVRPDALQ